jgi:hypothetical protein
MTSKNGWWKDKSFEQIPRLEVIHSASITAQSTANNKNVALLILDVSQYHHIYQIIEAHEHMKSATIQTTWGKTLDSEDIVLRMHWLEPTEAQFDILLNIERHMTTIDLIIKSQLVYLQPGKYGDIVMTTLENPRVIVEVPSRTFAAQWEKIKKEKLQKKFKSKGLNRSEVRKAINDYNKEMDSLLNFRLKRQ